MEINKPSKIETDLTRSTDLFVQSRIKPTHLRTNADLSHSRFLKFFQNLTDSWFITNMEEGRKNTLMITPKGKKYLD